MRRQRHCRRIGFTLMELLTAISIIAVLGGLGVYFLPSYNDSARAARGAGQLQNWLQIARTRAMRDGVPTGLRLIDFGSETTPAKFQYIAQPDDYAVGQASLAFNGTAGSGTTVQFSTGVDLYGGNASSPSVWAVQVGDYFEALDSGLVRRITAVPAANQITLASDIPFAMTPSGNSFPSSTIKVPNYRIIRQPRSADDESLELPSKIIVEPTKSIQMPGDSLISISFDIVFAPNGSVITPGVRDKVVFWVRDASRKKPDNSPAYTDGEPTLIAVFARSGFAAAYPIDVTGSDNYYYVRAK